MADDEIESYLAAEATQLERDTEVERILASFKLNPYDILELPFNADEKEIKNSYRKKSLAVHPDKCKHARADEAFNILASAQTLLLEEGKRANLLRVYEEARSRLCEEKKIKETDPQAQTADFKVELRKLTNKLLAEIEWKKRQLVRKELEDEGKAATELEKAREERKRKAEQEKAWEDTRDNRVASWRDFQTKKKGKKAATGELRPPKVTMEDSSKTFIKRPAKLGEGPPA